MREESISGQPIRSEPGARGQEVVAGLGHFGPALASEACGRVLGLEPLEVEHVGGRIVELAGVRFTAPQSLICCLFGDVDTDQILQEILSPCLSVNVRNEFGGDLGAVRLARRARRSMVERGDIKAGRSEEF